MKYWRSIDLKIDTFGLKIYCQWWNKSEVILKHWDWNPSLNHSQYYNQNDLPSDLWNWTSDLKLYAERAWWRFIVDKFLISPQLRFCTKGPTHNKKAPVPQTRQGRLPKQCPDKSSSSSKMILVLITFCCIVVDVLEAIPAREGKISLLWGKAAAMRFHLLLNLNDFKE